MHAARRAASDPDDAMERYTYVLERLREGDFRRLRAFSLNGTGKLTTWLVVVVRRLCIDHHRHVFGRERSEAGRGEAEAAARRSLAGHLFEDVDPDLLASRAAPADGELLRRERAAHLQAVLSELDTRDRLLLTLRYVDGYPPEKVASMLGYPSRFSVRRRVKVLLGRLRQRLEERGLEG